MAKLTLLEMTQDILSDIDSDEVNDVSDTPDSLQVAGIIKSTYYAIIDARDSWPHLRQLFQLNNLGSPDKLTALQLPDDIKQVETLKYNKVKSGETRAKYQSVTYLYPDEFLNIVNAYNTDADNVVLVDSVGGGEFPVKNDQAPTYWTSFDDEIIVFNSYDSAVEASVQGSKTQVVGYRSPSWTLANDFTPDLPDEAFSYLLSEAKKICFSRVKQVAEGTAFEQATRQRRAMSRNSWAAKGGIRMPDYSRKGFK